MRTFTWLIVVCCGLLVGGALPARGQDKGTPPATRTEGTRVALLDIAQVFKNDVRLKQRMEAIKHDVEAFDRELGEERKLQIKQKERLDTFQPGSPEYKRLEEEMARQMSNLQVKSQLKRKEIVELEAKAYFDTLTEINKVVAALAEQFNIQLVLRFESEDIDSRDPNSVSAGVKRAVVFQRSLDLTPRVVERLNQLASRPPANSAPKPR